MIYYSLITLARLTYTNSFTKTLTCLASFYLLYILFMIFTFFLRETANKIWYKLTRPKAYEKKKRNLFNIFKGFILLLLWFLSRLSRKKKTIPIEYWIPKGMKRELGWTLVKDLGSWKGFLNGKQISIKRNHGSSEDIFSRFPTVVARSENVQQQRHVRLKWRWHVQCHSGLQWKLHSIFSKKDNVNDRPQCENLEHTTESRLKTLLQSL